MTGLTGINSVHFVEKGCKATLVDSRKDKIDEATDLWKALTYDGRYEILYNEDLSEIPFGDRSFDLVWNFAALWHVKEANLLLSEMARISSKLVLIIVPNKKQIGYLFRKYILDKEFFKVVDEKWADIERVSSVLTSLGLRIKDQGVLDVPPWPDTCIPIGQIFEKLRIKKKGEVKKSNRRWSWDIMSYYSRKNPTLKEKVERFSFLERMSMPWQLKSLWAHHRYVVFTKN
jgi:SAM-dependent methyltransferase